MYKHLITVIESHIETHIDHMNRFIESEFYVNHKRQESKNSTHCALPIGDNLSMLVLYVTHLDNLVCKNHAVQN